MIDFILPAFIALLTFLAKSALAADEPAIPYQPLFAGIELAAVTATTDDGAPQRIFALKIDLKAEGISFMVTPGKPDGDGETGGQTVSQFLLEHHLQAAINASFFTPCCDRIPGQDKEVLGIAVSEGVMVSKGHDSACRDVLMITEDNQARITKEDDEAIGKAYTAVAGKLILQSSRTRGEVGGRRHPRTAVGLSEDKRHLILMVIDGRQFGYSLGATTQETARWIARCGAHDAINLDGGGSTTMVIDDEQGGIKYVNRPSEAQERFIACSFGVRAKRNEKP
ncbi:MAG: phosphodiester glycosidase family protein [Phycisphaeraceae bacterium]|nr:phosphodiester glycosidase family protein [Phycisphaeraceae bacterium]